MNPLDWIADARQYFVEGMEPGVEARAIDSMLARQVDAIIYATMWHQVIEPPPELKEIDEEVEQLNKDKESAIANQDFEQAAYLRDRAEKMRKKRDEIRKEWKKSTDEIGGTVDEDVIAFFSGDKAIAFFIKPLFEDSFCSCASQ